VSKAADVVVDVGGHETAGGKLEGRLDGAGSKVREGIKVKAENKARGNDTKTKTRAKERQMTSTRGFEKNKLEVRLSKRLGDRRERGKESTRLFEKRTGRGHGGKVREDGGMLQSRRFT
jgi:hypothetical protein